MGGVDLFAIVGHFIQVSIDILFTNGSSFVHLSHYVCDTVI